MTAARAELLADGGAAARSPEFFRSREFLDAEAVTHTLRVEAPGSDLVAPLIVREIAGSGEHDAVSPYGYPGIVRADGARPAAAIAAEDVDWSATGLVSAFIRGTAGGPHALAGRERSVLQIADPARPRKSRMSDRQQIRRNESRGYAVSRSPGPQSDEPARAGFRSVYEQTMRRTGASRGYLFDTAWFDAVLDAPRTWLVRVIAPDGERVAAASIAVRSDGYLHYFLSGTADAELRNAPSKNLIAALTELAEELELPLNLGGGLRPGDGLEEFKRGFANARAPFVTHEIVCDPTAYRRLSAGREPSGFFPAYRAPG